MSDADRVTPTATSREVETDTEAATGASLTAETFIDTVATFESAAPSLALKVNESDRVEVGAGCVRHVGCRSAEHPVRGLRNDHE